MRQGRQGHKGNKGYILMSGNGSVYVRMQVCVSTEEEGRERGEERGPGNNSKRREKQARLEDSSRAARLKPSKWWTRWKA